MRCAQPGHLRGLQERSAALSGGKRQETKKQTKEPAAETPDSRKSRTGSEEVFVQKLKGSNDSGGGRPWGTDVGPASRWYSRQHMPGPVLSLTEDAPRAVV